MTEDHITPRWDKFKVTHGVLPLTVVLDNTTSGVLVTSDTPCRAYLDKSPDTTVGAGVPGIIRETFFVAAYSGLTLALV
jgi:hypothetical protein